MLMTTPFHTQSATGMVMVVTNRVHGTHKVVDLYHKLLSSVSANAIARGALHKVRNYA